MGEPLTGMMACFACGTVTRPAAYIPAGAVCPACDAKRVEAAVAERCAPLVEALAFAASALESGELHAAPRIRAVLAAYHAAQGAGRGTS